MGLVIVTRVVSQFGKGCRRSMDQLIHGMLKARNPDKKLRTEPDPFQKQLLQITIGNIALTRQFVKI